MSRDDVPLSRGMVVLVIVAAVAIGVMAALVISSIGGVS